MTRVQLLNKSEIWIQGIQLHQACLPDIAHCCAMTLQLPAEQVFVTDVRPGLLVLDVLSQQVQLEHITGKQNTLFQQLREIPGVTLSEDARIHSEGILGVIGQDQQQATQTVETARKMQRQISDYTHKRIAIISTGAEIVAGEVRDTNFEAAREILGNAGYEVVFAGRAGDSENEIAGLVNRVAREAFGWIITTGGVGAEDKDKTIESLALLDPDIQTAPLAHYHKGHGRHVKDRVQIGIARLDSGLGMTTVFALPGPTHEVRLALPVILDYLKDGATNPDILEAIARPLRASLHQHS